MSERKANPVRGRVILEVTTRHAVIYLCDRGGYVTDQEVFRYPLALSPDECDAECRDLFGMLYDAINEFVNPELQDTPDGEPESE